MKPGEEEVTKEAADVEEGLTDESPAAETSEHEEEVLDPLKIVELRLRALEAEEGLAEGAAPSKEEEARDKGVVDTSTSDYAHAILRLTQVDGVAPEDEEAARDIEKAETSASTSVGTRVVPSAGRDIEKAGKLRVVPRAGRDSEKAGASTSTTGVGAFRVPPAAGTRVVPASEDGEEVPMPTTTALRRGEPIESRSRPGAFRMAPMATPHASDADVSTSDDEEEGPAEEDPDGSDDSSVLTMAIQIDDEPLALPQAEEFSARGRDSSKDKVTLFLVLACLAICGVIVLVMALVAGKKEPEPELMPVSTGPENSQDNGTIVPAAMTEEARILSLMPDSTVDAIKESGSSSQAFALDWLVQDPAVLSYPDWRIRQRFALATFFHSTGGVDGLWTEVRGWLDYDLHECDWSSNTLGQLAIDNPGIDVSNIAAVEAHNSNTSTPGAGPGPIPGPGAGLPGPPPTIIDEFPCGMNFNSSQANMEVEGQYTQLLLVNNNLAGKIPEEIFFLTNLTVFDLTTNRLVGTLPTQIGLLTALTQLHMGFNRMSGAIPTTLFLPNLWVSELHVNGFAGTIPTEIALASSLRVFVADENQLTGTLPTELGLLQENLEIFAVKRNMLTSTLPAEVLKFNKLVVLDVSHNRLSFAIPTEIGNVKSLRHLGLFGNHIYGTIPTGVSFKLACTSTTAT